VIADIGDCLIDAAHAALESDIAEFGHLFCALLSVCECPRISAVPL